MLVSFGEGFDIEIHLPMTPVTYVQPTREAEAVVCIGVRKKGKG